MAVEVPEGSEEWERGVFVRGNDKIDRLAADPLVTDWEAKVLAQTGAKERVKEIEDELRQAQEVDRGGPPSIKPIDWPEHWGTPEELRDALIAEGFTAEDAEAGVVSLQQALKGEGRSITGAELIEGDGE